MPARPRGCRADRRSSARFKQARRRRCTWQATMPPMTAPPPELWLARHGDTAWTVSRQHTGNTDLELNPEGEAAARALGPKLEGVAFDVVRSSPLRRALDTAHLAGFDPETDERLREFDYGEYEGVT